jgi:hypothetical protein
VFHIPNYSSTSILKLSKLLQVADMCAMKASSDYKIAWICALDVDYKAAKLMLGKDPVRLRKVHTGFQMMRTSIP